MDTQKEKTTLITKDTKTTIGFLITVALFIAYSERRLTKIETLIELHQHEAKYVPRTEIDINLKSIDHRLFRIENKLKIN